MKRARRLSNGDTPHSDAVPVSGFPLFDPHAYGWDGEDNDWPRRQITLSGLHRAAAAWAKDVTGKATGYHAAAAQAA